jgi:hypothetical protein
MTVDDDLLKAIAGYFLIRDTTSWTGRRARRVVVLSLIRLGRELPPARVGQLSSAVFELGREFQPLPGITQAVNWDREALSEAIRGVLPPTIGLEEEDMERLITMSAGKVRNANPNATKLPAWISIINQSLEQAQCEAACLSLEDKLALANVIEDILYARLAEIVTEASTQSSVTVADIVQRLAAATAAAPMRKPTDPKPSSTPVSRRETDARLDRLRPLVHPEQQDALDRWFSGLNDRLQRAVINSVERTKTNPFDPSRTRAIKLNTHTLVLRELKVQSRRLHLRILFRMEPFEILSFGLRRDLDALIEQARRVYAL